MSEYTKVMTDDIRQFIKEQNEETMRHFDVVAENLENKMDAVAEQVRTNTEKTTKIQEKLTEHDQKFDSINDALLVVKVDLEFIKRELKRKVDYDEFSALAKRVATLEFKAK